MRDGFVSSAGSFWLGRDQTNFHMGLELESYSNKDNTIESGAEVLNNNMELCINYYTATNTYNVVFFALTAFSS